MKLRNFLSIVSFIFPLAACALEHCFIAKENGQIVKQIGNCEQRHSPCSTFKVPLAVIGFETNILTSPYEPTFYFTEEIKKVLAPYYAPDKYPMMLFFERNHTPATWMQYSVIWYSQEITKKLGMEKLKVNLKKLNYGNQDISGNPGKNDGLLSSWIYSSLQISPLEQVNFIEKLSNRTLPFSKSAQENTVKIIVLENIWDNWRLYGKTGGGMDGGWFIGWVEKDQRRIQFAQYIEPQKSLISGGRLAKELAKDNLISLMLQRGPEQISMR
ncbi:MAG: class D beta-lactamase [Proteobacteria bacterium]|nr:class D beta-lactamase [Pseudomonadota bacterium]